MVILRGQLTLTHMIKSQDRTLSPRAHRGHSQWSPLQMLNDCGKAKCNAIGGDILEPFWHRRKRRIIRVVADEVRPSIVALDGSFVN